MRKLSASLILAFVYIPLAFATLTLLAIRPWVLDRGFYQHIVGDEHFYELALTEDLPQRFSSNVFTTVEQLPVNALSSALRIVVTPAYIREQALNIVDTVFDYIDGRVDTFQLAVDVTPIKTALAGESRMAFASVLAAALPNCTEGQSPIADGARLTRCIAEDVSEATVSAQIAAALPAVLEDTPDHLVISNQGNWRTSWYDYAWFLGSNVHDVLDVAIVMMIVTTLAIACVGAYVGGDDLRGRLKWFSTSLFAPASPFLLAGLLLTSPWLADPISRSMATVRWDGVLYSAAYREAMLNVLMPVIHQVGVGMMFAGGSTILIAIVVLICSWGTPSQSKQPPKYVQVPAAAPQ